MLEKAINICKADEESRKLLKDLMKNYSSKVNCHSSKQWPAYGKICHACQKPNHHAKFCPSKKILGVDQLNKYTVDQDILFVRTIQTKQEKLTKTKITKDESFVTLDVQNMPAEFKVDTGSQANIIPLLAYKKN